MIHPNAEISESASVGPNTKVWAHTQVCSGACVGADCIVGRDVYIDRGVVVGNRVKIQTGVHLYHGTEIEDGVFIGPGVCLTNDKHPRAITPSGSLQTDADWEVGKIHVGYGASLGAGAIILPNVSIGKFAMVGAGAVVVRDVPDYGLVMGVPARLTGYVCQCGNALDKAESDLSRWTCPSCQAAYLKLPNEGLRLLPSTEEIRR